MGGTIHIVALRLGCGWFFCFGARLRERSVRVIFFGYGNSSQIVYLQLMAKKIAVVQRTSGDVPNNSLDVFNQDVDSVEIITC